jgi:hypothetical protein
VAVQPGQKVVAGEKLAVIEAMKMENILTAAQDGVVKEVLAKPRARAWPWTNPSLALAPEPTGDRTMTDSKPFRILGIQQIAIGGPDKQR